MDTLTQLAFYAMLLMFPFAYFIGIYYAPRAVLIVIELIILWFTRRETEG
jgi:hypothetical protein